MMLSRVQSSQSGSQRRRRGSDYHVRGRHERIPGSDEEPFEPESVVSAETVTDTAETFETNPTFIMPVDAAETNGNNNDGTRTSTDNSDHQLPSSGPLLTETQTRSTLASGDTGPTDSQDQIQERTTATIPTFYTMNSENNNRTHTDSPNNNSSSSLLENVTANASARSNMMSAQEMFDTRLESELQSLIEQRDQYKSNTNSWVIIFSILLFRLVLEGVVSGDVGLCFLSLVGISYFFRWKVYRQQNLQTLEEQIENITNMQFATLNLTNTDDGNVDDEDEEMGNSTTAMAATVNTNNNASSSNIRDQQQQRRNRRLRQLQLQLSRRENDRDVDFEMWSFQAQLALALMESQRIAQGLEGDREEQNQVRGITDDKKKEWKTLEYSDKNLFYKEIQCKSSTTSDYGHECDDDEVPTCCICLCEYDKGDLLYQLQCGHVYHKDCIDSWCSNHVRCCLCNFDLDQNHHDQ